MATSMSHCRSTSNFKNRANISNHAKNSEFQSTNTQVYMNINMKRQKTNESVHQFYQKRKIKLKDLKIGHAELSGTLTENGIKVIEYNQNTKEATVEFDSCDNVKDVMGYLLKSFDVTIDPCKNLLCIANLPVDYDDEHLRELVLKYGDPVKSFMYRCLDNGETLGYGFVEFDCSIEKSKQIQQELDWSEIDGHHIHCDFVEATFYDKLCSKCLMIDNLSNDFTDVMALRDIFSRCHKPLYCQILMKSGKSLGYGIIEYHTPVQAQSSKNELDNHVINDQPIRLTYCIPGKPGFCLCSRIQDKFSGNGPVFEPGTKRGLLPDPVFMKDDLVKTPLARKLCDRQPELLPCFKQALNELQQTYLSQVTGDSKPGILGPAPSVQMNPLLNPNMQLGLMVLLSLQLQSKQQNKVLSPLDLFGLILNQQGQQGTPSSILGDPVAAQASVVLKNLISQISSNQPLAFNKSSNQNHRDNTQQNSSLQSLAMAVKNVNMNMLVNLGKLASSMQNSSSILGSGPNMTKQASKGMKQDQKPKSLLEIDLSDYERNLQNRNNSALKENIPNHRLRPQVTDLRGQHVIRGNAQYNDIQNIDGINRQPLMANMPYGSSNLNNNTQQVPPPLLRQNVNTLQNSLSLNNNSDGILPLRTQGSQLNIANIRPLMDNYPPQPIKHRPSSTKRSNSVSSGGYDEPDGLMPTPLMSRAYDGQQGLIQSQYDNEPQSFQRQYHESDGLMPTPLVSGGKRKLDGLMPPPLMQGQYDEQDGLMPTPSMTSRKQKLDGLRPTSLIQGHYDEPDGLMPPPLMSNLNTMPPPPSSIEPVPLRETRKHSDLIDLSMNSQFSTSLPSLLSLPTSSTKTYYMDDIYMSRTKRNRSQASSLSDYADSFFDQSSLYEQSYRSNDSLFSDGGLSSSGLSTPVGFKEDNVCRTPIGQKRNFSHLLPPPEPSPEGDFIGQHSQGIGGHYAESYKKRPRLEL